MKLEFIVKMNYKFLEILDKRRELDLQQILSKDFWKAFYEGIYPKEIKGMIAEPIEMYGRLLNLLDNDKEGIGYAETIVKYNFIINILAIKEIFFISIHNLEDFSIIATINYNPYRKINRNTACDKCYYSKKISENPEAAIILNKITRELFNEKKIELYDKPRITGDIPFERPIKIIICSAKWLELVKNNIKNNIELDLRGIAEELAAIPKLGLEPITVAEYATYSSNTDIRYQAYKAMSIMIETVHDISKRINKLRSIKPALSFRQIIYQIAEEDKIRPTSIASFGRSSKDPFVKKESIKIYHKLKAVDLEIEKRIIEIKKEKPNLPYIKIIKQIAKEKGKSPAYIAKLATSLENPEIRSKASKALLEICGDISQITERINEIKRKNPNLSFRQMAESVAREKNIKMLSVASYGSYSEDLLIRKESKKLRLNLSNSRYKKEIVQIWLKVKQDDNNIDDPSQIAIQISKYLKNYKNINLSPTRIAFIGGFSNNAIIKKDANKAYNILRLKNKNLIKKWLELKQNKQKLFPWEIAMELARKEKLSLRTLIGLILYSDNEDAKFDAKIVMKHYKQTGIFNKQFIPVMRHTLKIINNLIRTGSSEVSTTIIRKHYIKIDSVNNAIRNIIANCLKLLKNYNIILIKERKKAIIYSLPKSEINIDEFIENFKQDKNFRKILKDF